VKHVSQASDTPTANGTAADAAPSGVAHELHAFLSDVEDLITSATSLSGEDLARAKAKLAERIASAKSAVGKAGSMVSERARSGAKSTDTFVRDQPWQAVGITAAAALLVGFLLGRRSS
jgi:ElaB/YqjD/DUF883 family membrane-anchored ribosome-binding protein